VFDFLPDADVVCLESPPLVQVIAQVRFGSQTVLGTAAGAGAIHDTLADLYPRLLAEQQQVLNFTPSGSSASTVPQYRITDLHRSWSVVISTEQLSVETAAYVNWADMRSRLEAALKAVTDLANIRIRERVGLRYVNRVTPDDTGSFQGRIRPELLGPAGQEAWEKQVMSMFAQINARDGDTQLLLRTALAPESPLAATNSCLIDIDLFDDQPREFDLKEVLDYLDLLNNACYRCFSWSVPLDYRTSLGLKHEAESE
jgi:uncharacterized protein (TIGR04255 family)